MLNPEDDLPSYEQMEGIDQENSWRLAGCLGALVMFCVVVAVTASAVWVMRTVSSADEAASSAKQLAKEANAAILVSREESYKGRAMVCRSQILLGAKPTGPCQDPNVLKYYDPNEVRPTPVFICSLFDGLGLANAPADCEGR